jgi:outer membrane protein assembly factor BamB
MKLSKFKWLFVLIIGSLLLSACSVVTPSGWPGVTISTDGKYVYTAYQTGVFKVDASNGTMAWRYPDPVDNAKQFYAAPAVSDTLVVVGDYQNVLIGLDPATKAEKWTFSDSKDKILAGALIIGTTILAPSADGHLYALSLDGKSLWKFTGNAAFWGSPISDGKLVYVTSMDHFLYAINLSDGSVKWKTDLGAAGMYGLTLASDGNIYLSTLGNEVLAINATEGNILWHFQTLGSPWAVPVFKDGVVYVGDLSSKAYAISSSDGKSMWQVDAPGPITSSPAITTNGLIYASENGDVFELSFTGTKDWDKPNSLGNGKLYSAPVVAGNMVVVGVTTGDNNLLLMAFDFTGTQKWTFSVPK